MANGSGLQQVGDSSNAANRRCCAGSLRRGGCMGALAGRAARARTAATLNA
jgi:hypothetical protein